MSISFINHGEWNIIEKQFANLDGFRVYKVKNRGDHSGDRLFIAPVYVMGLPGDVDLLNKEIYDSIPLKREKLVDEPKDNDKERKMAKGGCCQDD